MNIIYGGSFNPPTIAHYEIAKFILNEFTNSDFYFLPTNNFYNKDNLRDFFHRVKMLEIVAKNLGPRAKVSSLEGQLDKYYGTYYTLSHFLNPHFLIGADNFITISTWINYPKLISEHKFIIIPRDGINISDFIENDNVLKEYKDNFLILNKFKEINLSSSSYRKTKDNSLLLEEVAAYIKNNNLYEECTDVL